MLLAKVKQYFKENSCNYTSENAITYGKYQFVTKWYGDAYFLGRMKRPYFAFSTLPLLLLSFRPWSEEYFLQSLQRPLLVLHGHEEGDVVVASSV